MPTYQLDLFFVTSTGSFYTCWSGMLPKPSYTYKARLCDSVAYMEEKGCISSSFFKNKFIYLSLAVLGLRCCTWALSSCSERGLFFAVVSGLLIAVASLVAEHGL